MCGNALAFVRGGRYTRANRIALSITRGSMRSFTASQPASTTREQRYLAELLARADVGLDGARAWDIVVHDERMARRVIAQGSIGAGESYMDGWWDCEALDEMCARVFRAGIERRLHSWRGVTNVVLASL